MHRHHFVMSSLHRANRKRGGNVVVRRQELVKYFTICYQIYYVCVSSVDRVECMLSGLDWLGLDQTHKWKCICSAYLNNIFMSYLLARSSPFDSRRGNDWPYWLMNTSHGSLPILQVITIMPFCTSGTTEPWHTSEYPIFVCGHTPRKMTGNMVEQSSSFTCGTSERWTKRH